MRVQGEGHPDAFVAFIGDAPHRAEVTAGRPFVGRAGTLLTRALTGDALPSRDEVWITNLVRERCVTATGHSRPPTQIEIDRDWPDLELELGLITPRILVPIGPVATQALLGAVDLARVHSIPHPVGEYVIVPVYDPHSLALFTYDMHYLAKFLHGEAQL
jgi:uracil-DNA glycosylase family 4